MTEKNQLKKQMKTRHITMLALGGAIGAGLFKGSGEAIQLAGPAVLLAFIFCGLILFVVMTGLGQLVLSDQKQHGLSGLVQPYLGVHTADFIDWIYWSMWMINIIAEAVAAASFLQLWFPNIPAWIFVLILALLTTIINLFSVRLFAETEYWLSWAKISVVIALILVGLYLVATQVFDLGFFPTMRQMTDYGGFAPHGLKGFINSLLVVIYSYGGSELVAITISEAENPKKAIPQAIKGVMTRIAAFYIIPLFLLLIIYPWNQLADPNVSPFVMVFQKIHVPFASDIVNLVIILALFSSINSGVYASSRTLFFRLSNNGQKKSRFTMLNKNSVPQQAIMFCSGTLYLGVVLSYFLGDKLFNYLAGSLSYTVLLIWLLISAAAFVLVRKQKKMGYTIFLSGAILALILLFVGILITNPLAVTGFTALLYTIIFLSFYWNHRKIEKASEKS